ncbi:MAG: hypothetical protein A2X86_11850 [Bdellovibrionales bacterium GWA2_49_15]|nr:MAG: hypothetical protein A2X86_11850 [Bdellovibrionales bacterium GWA2_49_15]HAZ12555.1 hypothetical protein [Bdellovibrionales bacterium]
MKTKMLILILVLLATSLVKASEVDRLACDSVRAVHGVRYDNIKEEAKTFLRDAGPAHLANQNLLKRTLPRLQALTKKYQQLVDHLPGHGEIEMRKMLVQEFFTKAQGMLHAAGVSYAGILRSSPCSNLGGCNIENAVILNGLDSLPWSPSMEFKVRHKISRDAISIPEEHVSRFLGFSKVNLLSGTSDIGSALDAKVAAAQLELVQAHAQGKSEDALAYKITSLGDAWSYQRVATQPKHQFIEEELTLEQRTTCDTTTSSVKTDSEKVVSHGRKMISFTGEVTQARSVSSVQR